MNMTATNFGQATRENYHAAIALAGRNVEPTQVETKRLSEAPDTEPNVIVLAVDNSRESATSTGIGWTPGVQATDSTDDTSVASLDLPNSPPLTNKPVGSAPVVELEATILKMAVVETPLTADSSAAKRGQTHIPSGWTFNGDVVGDAPMTFDCDMVGNIENTGPKALISMGQKCTSDGTITGKHIALKGKHKGKIDAAGGQVVIDSTAKVTGDVVYTTIQINGGEHKFNLQYVGGEASDVATTA